MTTRPTDTPKWADAGTIDEPADPKQDAGFLFQEFVPFGWMNWAWNRFALWSAHFASTASRFTSPADALVDRPEAPFDIGDTCIIGNYDQAPGVSTGSWAPLNPTLSNCIAVGDLVAGDTGGDINFYAADGSGLVLAITPTITTSFGRFVTNGEYTIMWDHTAVAPANNVEVYRHLNGAQVALSLGSGQLVTKVAIGPEQFYVAFDDNGVGSHDLEARDLINLTQTWAFNHAGGGGLGRGVADLVAFGGLLYLIGSISNHASGASMRCIEASTGRDLTGEGGVGTSPALEYRLWNQVATPTDPPFFSKRRALRCDGKILVYCDITNDNVEIRNPGDGLIEKVLTFPGGEGLQGVEIDHAFLYVDLLDPALAPDGGLVYCFGRGEWTYHWRFPASAGGAGISAPVTSSDGFAVYIENRSAAGRTLRLQNAFGPRIAIRVDPKVHTFREGNGHPFNRKIV